jgi:nicotinamidase-related amidase
MAVYLLHFDPPYKHAKHYLGFSEDIPGRIRAHVTRNGSPLVAAAKAQGSRVILTRVWPSAHRDDERRLKRQRHGLGYFCPRCNAKWAQHGTFC